MGHMLNQCSQDRGSDIVQFLLVAQVEDKPVAVLGDVGRVARMLPASANEGGRERALVAKGDQSGHLTDEPQQDTAPASSRAQVR